MTRGPLMPKLIRFALPLMLSGLLQIAFNAADLVVVGRFGRPTALAAVGSNGALVNLVVNILMGLSLGGSIISARFYGAGDDKNVLKAASTTVLVGFFGGILFAGIGAALAVPLLHVVGSPDDVLPLAAVYLRIYFAGMPVIALYNFAGAALRAFGNTRQPLIYLAIAGVLNVGMNLLFVIVLGIDVAGVALATVLSQCVSCFLTVRCLFRSLNLRIRDLRFSKRLFRKMLSIGIPAGVQGSLFSVSNFIIQSAVNSFGTAVIAGNAACISLEAFIGCPQDAMMQSATTCISQNLGAGEFRRSVRSGWYCQLISCIASLVLGGLVLLLRRPLLGLYTPDAASLEAGLVRMSILVTTVVLNGTMAVSSGINRGIGHSTASTVMTFLGACAFRIVWVCTVFAHYGTYTSLLISYPISWTLVTLLQYVFYFSVRKKAFLRSAEKVG